MGRYLPLGVEKAWPLRISEYFAGARRSGSAWNHLQPSIIPYQRVNGSGINSYGSVHGMNTSHFPTRLLPLSRLNYSRQFRRRRDYHTTCIESDLLEQILTQITGKIITLAKLHNPLKLQAKPCTAYPAATHVVCMI
ncbi:hypothetical protein M405DRAFT_336984 [Rhizopogon salebrosus TDB-379]|nr:hypothetical protein M405DRAFT_336984 [Rhizopogon salebrosus TDB-379]